MNSLPQAVSQPLRIDARDFPRLISLVALWLLATLIATFFAMIIKDSAIINDVYIPRSNDSFYHARRILDFAVGNTSFYQFEPRINPPEGIWIPWPWGYDYFMAKLVQAVLWLRPGTDPMAILAYVPVGWIGINAALFLAAASALGLSVPMRALVMLAFALSPLTQLLHGIAMIDHHFVEHTFVLLNIWLGVAWMNRPDNYRRAIALGLALGIAPAFHNGLFLLQLVPLLTLLILWLKGNLPSTRSIHGFALSLFLATLLVAIPSEPFRRGMFAFGYLSGFHLYVSLCTAAVLVLARWKPFSMRNLALLGGVSLALAVPLLAQFALGAAFVSGGVSILKNILEAQSPLKLMTVMWGPAETASYYSWLILLVPVAMVFAIYTLIIDRRPGRIYFAAASVLGLGLMVAQFRFYYFGLFALITSVFLICDLLRDRFRWHRGMVFVAAFALEVLAFQPALRQRLFTVYAISADPEYQYGMTVFFKLGEVCRDDPGLVLANNDDGSPILYHSDCSVIANNFFLDAHDQSRIDKINDYMRYAGAAELLAADPPIKYLFVRRDNFSVQVNGDKQLDTGNRIVSEVFLPDEPPEGYEVLATVYEKYAEDAEPRVYSRLYRLHPDPAAD